MTYDEQKARIALSLGREDWRLTKDEIETLLVMMASGQPDDFGDYQAELESALIDLKETRALLLSFIGGLALCDHMGDVSNNVVNVLKRLKIETPQADDDDEFWPGLARDLHALGVTTMYGSALYDPRDDEEPDE